jgi:hypothetical protein
MMKLKSAFYPVLFFTVLQSNPAQAETECPIDSINGSKTILSKSFSAAQKDYLEGRMFSAWINLEKMLISKANLDQTRIGIQCMGKIQSQFPQLLPRAETQTAMVDLLKKRTLKGAGETDLILLLQKSLLKSDANTIEQFITSGGMKIFNATAPRVRLIQARHLILKGKIQEAATLFNAIVKDKQETKLDRAERDFLYFHLKLGRFVVKSYKDSLTFITKLPSKQTAPLYPEEVHIQFWNHVKLNNYENALSLFFTLKSPYLRDNYFADIHHAAATLFMEKCHFNDANAALHELKTIYLPILAWVQKSVKNKDEAYEDVVSGIASNTIPIQLLTELLRNTSLPLAQEMILTINEELKSSPKNETLLNWKTELKKTVNSELAVQLKNIELDLIDLFDDARLIEIDLLAKFAKQKTEAISAEELKEIEVDQKENTANQIGTGEMWADETHVVKVKLDNRCVKKKK